MLSGDCPTALTISIISIETVVRPTGLFRCNQRKCKSRNAFTTQKYGLRKTRDKALAHSGTWRKMWLIMGVALIANSESTHDVKPRVSPVFLPLLINHLWLVRPNMEKRALLEAKGQDKENLCILSSIHTEKKWNQFSLGTCVSRGELGRGRWG